MFVRSIGKTPPSKFIAEKTPKIMLIRLRIMSRTNIFRFRRMAQDTAKKILFILKCMILSNDLV